MFKNQVEEYCEFSEMENCVDELTRYGLKKLRVMSETQLDEMDPYQRGASSISEYFFWFVLGESFSFMRRESCAFVGLLISLGNVWAVRNRKKRVDGNV